MRRHANQVFRKVIKPALSNLGYEPKRIDQSADTGSSITESIIERLWGCRLCIAVLTGLNPNVMYEVGVRHACDLPLIPLAEVGTKLPFDLKDYSTIFYSLDSDLSIKRAVQQLAQRASAIHGSQEAAKSRVPARMLSAFFHAMRVLGQRYSLEPIFAAKGNAIRLLMDHLRRIQREVGKDFESGNLQSGPLNKHSESLVCEFDELATTVSVFEGIVQNSICHQAPRGHCDTILEQMKYLQRDGWRMCKSWKDAQGTKVGFETAMKDIDSLLVTCQRIFEITQ